MKNEQFSTMELKTGNILSFAPYIPESIIEDIRKEGVKGLGLVKDGTAACGA